MGVGTKSSKEEDTAMLPIKILGGVALFLWKKSLFCHLNPFCIIKCNVNAGTKLPDKSHFGIAAPPS